MNVATLVEGHEGRRRKMYKCSAGFNTIGVGHNLDANPISDRAIDVILADDLADVERALDHHLPWWRREDTVRQASLIDLAFNLGIVGSRSLPAICGQRSENAKVYGHMHGNRSPLRFWRSCSGVPRV